MSAPDVAGAIEQPDAVEARRRQLGGALLIDVRDDDERALGTPDGAIGMPGERLLREIAALAPPEREVLLICAAG